MNRILRIALIPVLVATFALAGVGVVYAQTTPSTSLQVMGTISAINPTASPAPTVTITPDGGSPVVVNVVANTVITKGGVGSIALSDLAVGNRVKVVYDKDTMNATKITVKNPVDEEHEPIIGTIKSIGSSSFVVTTRKQGDVTVSVNGDTKYKVPGMANATLANFKVGDRVAVLTEANGGSLALQVVLIPGKAIGLEKERNGHETEEQSSHMERHNGHQSDRNPAPPEKGEGATDAK